MLNYVQTYKKVVPSCIDSKKFLSNKFADLFTSQYGGSLKKSTFLRKQNKNILISLVYLSLHLYEIYIDVGWPFHYCKSVSALITYSTMKNSNNGPENSFNTIEFNLKRKKSL